MITLSVLVVLIALVMVLLSYFEEVRQDASDSKALIQADLYYADINTIFKRFKKKKTLFSTLYLYPIPLVSEDGKFSLILDCQPLSKAVNINWLGLSNDSSMSEAYTFAQEVFDSLVQEYNIADAGRLHELLLEEIGGQRAFVTRAYSRLHQKNAIISYKQFKDILARYQLEVDDENVAKVPWEKYFSFSSAAKRIDVEYASVELIALLFDLELQVVQEWDSSTTRGDVKTFVLNNAGNYASRKKILLEDDFLEESTCMVSYLSAGQNYRFAFEYIEGEAKHFEFYGKY